jgi:hypothetical protein
VFWIETNGNYVMGFNSTTWPAVGQLGDMLLIVQVATQSDTLTFTTTSPGITLGFTDIPGASLNNPSTGSGTLYFDTVGTYMLRFTTIDSGKNIQITDLSRNFATLRDPNLYWNDANPSYPVPTLLVGFGASQTSFTQALAAESGQDTVSVFGSYNSVAVGNLTLGNINYPAVDTGQMGGYSVSAARGNLQIINGISTTTSNDFLGYFNGIAYTGTGLSSQPAFQQVSSIGFYATGSNPTYGLGGNIAFFTHVPAATGNVMTQAMGIENDQSTHIFGNIFLSATNNTGTGTSSYVPASSSSAGTTGQVAWNQSYIYICTGPSAWKRIALSTF